MDAENYSPQNNSKIITFDKNFKLDNDNCNDEAAGFIESLYDSVNNSDFHEKLYLMSTQISNFLSNSFTNNPSLIEIADQPHNLNIVSLSFNKNIILYAKNNGESYITDGELSKNKKLDNKINISDYKLTDNSDISFKNVFKLTGSLNKKYVVKVLCGRAHVIFMTHAGMVFSFGEGSKGQLGHGNSNDLQEPTMITSLLNYRFTDISVGGDHNWGIATIREISKKNLSNSTIIEADKCKEQLIFVWGDNSKGQLCMDVKEFQSINNPTINEKIEGNESLVNKIQCGVEHTLILFDDDRVFGVGSNEYGQINPYIQDNIISNLNKIKLKWRKLRDEKIKFKLVKSSAYSSLFYTEDNHIYLIGKFNKKISNYETNNIFNNSSNTQNFRKQTALKIDDEYDSELDLVFTDSSLILLYDSKICESGELKYEEIIENEVIETDNTNTPKKHLVLTEEEKLTHSNLRKNIKNINLENVNDTINFVNFKYVQGEESELEQENELNSSKIFMMDNSYSGEFFDANVSFEQSIEELRSYINLVGISYVADRGTSYSMSFRPKNLPRKTPEEENYHRKLVEENRKKYVQFLKEKQEEERKMKALLEKRKQKNKKLQEEWENNILPNWFSKRKDPNFLKKYFYEGIPTNLRGKVWLLCIGNNFSITPDYYEIEVKKAIQILIEVQENEKRLYTKEKESKIDSNTNNSVEKNQITTNNFIINLNSDDPSIKLKSLLSKYNITVVDKERSIQYIELDIERTFSYLGVFKTNSPLSEDLREILRAFVASRPDIGYVQGLSYIAGTLLLNMEKYQAFVALMNLTLSPNIIPFYRFDERQIRNRLQIFKQIFYSNIPELCDYFEELDILPEHYLIEWTMTLFSKNLNIDIVARIWDIYMIEGIKSIYQAAIGKFFHNYFLVILSHFEKKFMMSDFEYIMQSIKNINSLNFDEDQFVELMRQVKFPDWIEQEIQKLKDEYIPI